MYRYMWKTTNNHHTTPQGEGGTILTEQEKSNTKRAHTKGNHPHATPQEGGGMIPSWGGPGDTSSYIKTNFFVGPRSG